MEETNTPMFKSVRPDEVLSVQKDPVSGNTAPLGATPAEVRDDIPIMASPNEFMIDAATRRYYGTDFFEGLQAAAKQGFQRIKAGEESFFRDDELEIEEEAQKMFEGGEIEDKQEELKQNVASKSLGYGGVGPMFLGFEFKTYVHPTKPEIQISFFNGRPLRPIPDGYTLKADTPVEQRKQKEVDTIGGDGEGVNIKQGIPKTYANTSPIKWTAKDFQQYASDMSNIKSEDIGKVTMTDRIALGFVGNSIAPGLGLGLITQAKRIKRAQAKSINNRINDLLKQGIDADGNPLTDETNKILFNAQQAANQQDANAGGTTATGISITDQPFYQTDSGEIDIDALMPPSASDDDDDKDPPFDFTEEEEAENLESRETNPFDEDEEAI
tara:strand:- start:48 stop:1199 length:1152 start_codon:yes stop_codon:yes gene_type:complete